MYVARGGPDGPVVLASLLVPCGEQWPICVSGGAAAAQRGS